MANDEDSEDEDEEDDEEEDDDGDDDDDDEDSDSEDGESLPEAIKKMIAQKAKAASRGISNDKKEEDDNDDDSDNEDDEDSDSEDEESLLSEVTKRFTVQQAKAASLNFSGSKNTTNDEDDNNDDGNDDDDTSSTGDDEEENEEERLNTTHHQLEWSKIDNFRVHASGPFSTLLRARHADFPNHDVAVKLFSLAPTIPSVDALAELANKFKEISDTTKAADDNHPIFVPILQVISHNNLPLGMNLTSVAIVSEWNLVNAYDSILRKQNGVRLTLSQKTRVLMDVVSALQALQTKAKSAHGGVCLTNLYLHPQSKRGMLRLCPYPWQEVTYYCSKYALSRTSRKLLLACEA